MAEAYISQTRVEEMQSLSLCHMSQNIFSSRMGKQGWTWSKYLHFISVQPSNADYVWPLQLSHLVRKWMQDVLYDLSLHLPRISNRPQTLPSSRHTEVHDWVSRCIRDCAVGSEVCY